VCSRLAMDRRGGNLRHAAETLSTRHDERSPTRGNSSLRCRRLSPRPSSVSSSWYSDPLHVPTWNYVVVHAHGPATLLNTDELRAALSDLVTVNEQRFPTPSTPRSGWPTSSAALPPPPTTDALPLRHVPRPHRREPRPRPHRSRERLHLRQVLAPPLVLACATPGMTSVVMSTAVAAQSSTGACQM
jgi:Putative FMN-binding domain